MLYLEDFLEMIENLPMEMRDRFTEMRETELQVQNAMDSLEDRVKVFFRKCGSAPIPKQDWKDEQFEKMKQDYAKALEDADEKVQLANQIYDLVERHLRKLDQELAKFKMELEADNAGITEVLEKRSLELDNPPPLNNHRAEKRKYSSTLSNHVEKKASTDRVLSSLAHDAARETLTAHRVSSTASSPATTMFDSTPASARQTPAISYSLGHVGAGSNAAIAAAASRAIGATLEVRKMQQGRRTASLKASYEAVTRNVDLSKELQLGGRELASGGSSTPAESAPTPKSSARKSKGQRAAQAQAAAQASTAAQPAVAPTGPPSVPEVVAPGESLVPMDIEDPTSTTTNWQYDPNEPRYCICNDVSYGDMVGCDNDDCPIEWFHYGCVGLAQAPKGKWFCPQCAAAMKRRGRK